MIHALALRLFGVLPRFVRNRIVRLLYPTFTAGVGVCFIDPDGSIALVTHSYARDWGLPGGLLDRGEEPQETARREMREELGVDVEINTSPVALKTPGRRHFNFLFTVELDASRAASLASHSPEITGIGWYPLDGLPPLSEYTDLFLTELGLLPPPPPRNCAG